MTQVAGMVLAALMTLGAGDAVLAVLHHGRRRAGLERLAFAFLLGTGVVSLLEFWASFLVRGSGLVWLTGGGILLLVILSRRPFMWLRWLSNHARAMAGPRQMVASTWTTGLAWGTLALEVVRNVVASFGSPLGWDGLVDWAFKANVVFLSGGIPASYFMDLSREWSHLDYPWLIPLNEAWVYFLTGGMNDKAIKLLFASFDTALLLLVFFAGRRWLSAEASFVITALFALVPALDSWAMTGYADVPLAALWLAAAICFCDWLQSSRAADLLLSGIFAALAAWTKNEGLVLLAFQSAAVAAVVLQRRNQRLLAQAAAYAAACAVVIGPWLALRQHYHLPNSDFLAVTLANTLDHLDRLPLVAVMTLQELTNVQDWGLLWLVFCFTLSLLWRREDRPLNAYLALSVSVPLLALLGSYLYSQYVPVADHIGLSVPRLLLQQAPIAALVISRGFREEIEASIQWLRVLFNSPRQHMAAS